MSAVAVASVAAAAAVAGGAATAVIVVGIQLAGGDMAAVFIVRRKWLAKWSTSAVRPSSPFEDTRAHFTNTVEGSEFESKLSSMCV